MAGGRHGNRLMESESSSEGNNTLKNGATNLFGNSTEWQKLFGNEGGRSRYRAEDNKQHGDAESIEMNEGEGAKNETGSSFDADEEIRSTDPTEEITDSEGKEHGCEDDEDEDEGETRYEVSLRVDLNITDWNPEAEPVTAIKKILPILKKADPTAAVLTRYDSDGRRERYLQIHEISKLITERIRIKTKQHMQNQQVILLSFSTKLTVVEVKTLPGIKKLNNPNLQVRVDKYYGEMK